jgi:nicotinamide-nucleotide adenylyltransferase
MVARWKPVHLGHEPVLRALCDRGERALIGVGSSNRHNLKNPFTFEESVEMIRLALGGRANCEVLPVPDLDDGPRWRTMVAALFGPLDLFVTDNPYVAHLMAPKYCIGRPVDLVPPQERVPLDGTMVRSEMARGSGWREMVPPEVADYIVERGLDERFRREFGLETLASCVVTQGAPAGRTADVLLG